MLTSRARRGVIGRAKFAVWCLLTADDKDNRAGTVRIDDMIDQYYETVYGAERREYRVTRNGRVRKSHALPHRCVLNILSRVYTMLV